MKFVKQKIEGVFLIKHKGFSDKRGLFSIYCKKIIKNWGLILSKQIFRITKKIFWGDFTIKFLNLQKKDYNQKRKIYDIVIDLRKKSKTYRNGFRSN